MMKWKARESVDLQSTVGPVVDFVYHLTHTAPKMAILILEDFIVIPRFSSIIYL
jgi:hypothetical protein